MTNIYLFDIYNDRTRLNTEVFYTKNKELVLGFNLY